MGRRRLLASYHPPVPDPPLAPVRFWGPDPEAWRLAVVAAGGDHERCVPLPDGSVLTLNRRPAELPADHWHHAWRRVPSPP